MYLYIAFVCNMSLYVTLYRTLHLKMSVRIYKCCHSFIYVADVCCYKYKCCHVIYIRYYVHL